MNESKQTAKTILNQLGGNKFVAMTGAHNFTFDDKGTLMFRFKGCKNFKILKIRLNSLDTYDMTFIQLGNAPKHKITRKEINGIYDDGLQQIFTQETGLYTHL